MRVHRTPTHPSRGSYGVGAPDGLPRFRRPPDFPRRGGAPLPAGHTGRTAGRPEAVAGGFASRSDRGLRSRRGASPSVVALGTVGSYAGTSGEELAIKEDLVTSTELVPVPRAPQGVAEHSVRVLVGVTLAGVGLTANALRRSRGLTSSIQSRADPPLLGLVPGAVLGLSWSAARRASALATKAFDNVGSPLARVLMPVVRPLEEPLRRALAESEERWRSAEAESMQAAAAFVRELEPRIARAVLEPLDLTALMSESVDLDELAEQIDVQRIAERIDPNAIAEGIDVDRVAERLDLDAIVLRLDLPTLVEDVLAEIDVADLIRQSTGTLTGDAIDEVRYVSVDADRVVARFVDRIIRRRKRHLDAPGEPESAAGRNEI